MILGHVYSVVRSLLDLLVLCLRSKAALRIEVLALRHQVPRPRTTGPPARSDSAEMGPGRRRDRLGGVLHEYVRQAA